MPLLETLTLRAVGRAGPLAAGRGVARVPDAGATKPQKVPAKRQGGSAAKIWAKIWAMGSAAQLACNAAVSDVTLPLQRKRQRGAETSVANARAQYRSVQRCSAAAPLLSAKSVASAHASARMQ